MKNGFYSAFGFAFYWVCPSFRSNRRLIRGCSMTYFVQIECSKRLSLYLSGNLCPVYHFRLIRRAICFKRLLRRVRCRDSIIRFGQRVLCWQCWVRDCRLSWRIQVAIWKWIRREDLFQQNFRVWLWISTHLEWKSAILMDRSTDFARISHGRIARSACISYTSWTSSHTRTGTIDLMEG